MDESSDVVAIHGPFSLTRTGMMVAPGVDPTFQEWEAATQWTARVVEASPWWRAALLVYGEQRFGEMYAQAVEATGLAVGTLMNEVYVFNRVDASRRRENVPFAMHQEVAPLEPAEQEYWLQKVEEDGLTREQLRAQLRSAKAQALLGEGKAVQLWLVVACSNAQDQADLYNRMVAEGRAVKMKVVEEMATT